MKNQYLKLLFFFIFITTDTVYSNNDCLALRKNRADLSYQIKTNRSKQIEFNNMLAMSKMGTPAHSKAAKALAALSYAEPIILQDLRKANLDLNKCSGDSIELARKIAEEKEKALVLQKAKEKADMIAYVKQKEARRQDSLLKSRNPKQIEKQQKIDQQNNEINKNIAAQKAIESEKLAKQLNATTDVAKKEFLMIKDRNSRGAVLAYLNNDKVYPSFYNFLRSKSPMLIIYHDPGTGMTENGPRSAYLNIMEGVRYYIKKLPVNVFSGPNIRNKFMNDEEFYSVYLLKYNNDQEVPIYYILQSLGKDHWLSSLFEKQLLVDRDTYANWKGSLAKVPFNIPVYKRYILPFIDLMIEQKMILEFEKSMGR